MADDLAGLRAAREAARDETGRAAGRLAEARAALGAAEASGAPPDVLSQLRSGRDHASAVLADAKSGETSVRDQIRAAIAALPDGPAERIGQLDAAHPVAFLPVRVETRFRRGPVDGQPNVTGELLVRIYPDALMADDHEPLLTAREVAAGQDYWRRTAREGGERDAWTALITEVTVPRAAWIVERTTPANPGDPDPEFPDLEVRPDGWHRAPEARALPERWVVTALRGDRRVEAVSEPVREGLALTVRLAGDDTEEDGGGDATVDLTGDGLTVDPELAWAYDFDEALAAGMAVRLPLNDDDLANGFATLLVVGVRTTEDAETQAGRLAKLLDAHRFSRGLSFVPQGTKTNNTLENPSDYPPADPAGKVSFPVARGAPLATDGSDGLRCAAALGVDAATFDHVWGADRDEQRATGSMVNALWPATMGYFLEQLMAPHISTQTADAVRAWARDWVRPRGPLPAFRVGAVPYGVLPVASPSDWIPDPAEGAPGYLPGFVGLVASMWSRGGDEPPRVGRTADPDADLVELLGMDASTQTAKIRQALGFDTSWNVFSFSRIDPTPWDHSQARIARTLAAALGEPPETFVPRALFLSFAARKPDFAGPMVADVLSETDPLPFDYVAWLRTAFVNSMKDQHAPPTDAPIDALLYLMLRQAFLTEYDRSARALLGLRQLLHPHEEREPELVDVVATRAILGPHTKPPVQRSSWERLNEQIAGISDDTLGQFLHDPQSADKPLPADVRQAIARIAAYRNSLRVLEGVPTAELHRLFTETLDAYSHRLDAWVTSLATRRLAALREAHPRGVWLGCYGWVQDLVPDPAADVVEVTLPDTSVVQARIDAVGYTLAPSMQHAATAAVLRSAYVSRTGDDREPYSVDLSSKRVRTALALLDAVRDAQPLGAILGYQFERGLHDGHHGVELDRFIDDFRGLYPPVAGKTEDPGVPAEQVAARNVVDGLRLLRAWQTSAIPFGTGGLTPDATQRAAIEAELVALDDAVDALSDLLLAESVHQVVKGSPAGAAATLETLAQGHRPPEPEVVTAPRGGTVLHQRVALLFDDGAPPAAWGAVTPRAAAAPELNAWLGRLFGNPAAIACTANPEGAPARAVTVRDLGLHPVDLLLAVRATITEGDGRGRAELDRRVAWQVTGAGPDAPVTIDYETAPDGALSFAAAMELADAVSRLLGFGRALTPADLLPPEHAAAAGDPMSAELTQRADAARAALAKARQDLADAADIETLRAALVDSAALGAPSAFPSSRHDASADAHATLGEIAAGVAAELTRRAADADAADGPAEQLGAVFGRELPVLPRFRPALPELLGPALAAEPGLGPEPGPTVEGWLAQLARVRAPVDAWRDVRILARAVGRDVPRPRIAQVPLEPQAAWAALPFGEDAGRPRSGLVSLALVGAAPPAAGQPWAGMLLDTWPELLPSHEEDAGVAFHFDAPRAEAPQAVLLAVPPGPDPTWSYERLERTLLGALDLARTRAHDLSTVGPYAQLVPLTFLAANTANATVSTSFAGLLRADAIIREA